MTVNLSAARRTKNCRDRAPCSLICSYMAKKNLLPGAVRRKKPVSNIFCSKTHERYSICTSASPSKRKILAPTSLRPACCSFQLPLSCLWHICLLLSLGSTPSQYLIGGIQPLPLYKSWKAWRCTY